MFSMKRSTALGGLLLLLAAPSAHAAVYSHSGALCAPINYDVYQKSTRDYFGQLNQLTSPATYYCPIVYESTPVDPGRVEVTYYDRSDAGSVQCYAYVVTASGMSYASATASSSFAGLSGSPQTMTVDTTIGGTIPGGSWTAGANYGLSCTVPATDGGWPSGIAAYRSIQ
jgi:hypothetical protein